MKISKWFAITLAAAVTAGGALLLKTQAADAAPPRRAFRGQLLERARAKLGLTDEQVAQIKTQLAGEKDA